VVLDDFRRVGRLHRALHEPGAGQPADFRRFVGAKLQKDIPGFADSRGAFGVHVKISTQNIRAGLIEEIDGDIKASLTKLLLQDGYLRGIGGVIDGGLDRLDRDIEILAGLDELGLGGAGLVVSAARVFLAHGLRQDRLAVIRREPGELSGGECSLGRAFFLGDKFLQQLARFREGGEAMLRTLLPCLGKVDVGELQGQEGVQCWIAALF